MRYLEKKWPYQQRAAIVLLLRIKSNLMKCQECNRQCKQAEQAKPPRKPPPERANISDFARAAAREQPKADQE
jgi:hypothetical protein